MRAAGRRAKMGPIRASVVPVMQDSEARAQLFPGSRAERDRFVGSSRFCGIGCWFRRG